jgi:nucleoside-diphosphate-sugar epimerase
LPLRSISARRSLLALENLFEAIDAVLKTPAPLRRPLIVADIEALTVGEMVAAMRQGLGRRPAIFAAPPMVLKLLLRSIGKDRLYQRVSGSLVANPSALMALGWKPALTTPVGLQQLMYAYLS